MKYSVPATAPVAVRPEKPAWPKLFASPKSAILTCPSVAAEQQVLGLQVAVHEALRVRVRQAGQRLAREADRVLHREGRAARLQDRAHAAARAVLHREVEAVVGRAVVQQLDDVRMAQRARHVDLALEDLAGGGVDERLRQQDLERDRASVRAPAGQVDGAHAAPGQRALDLVALDLRHLRRRTQARHRSGHLHGRWRGRREADPLGAALRAEEGAGHPRALLLGGGRDGDAALTAGRRGLDRDLEVGVADPHLVAVLEVDLQLPGRWRLLRPQVPRPAAEADAVHHGAVEAAQVAQPRRGGVHLEQEVVPRGGRVGRVELGVAVGRAAEEERVMGREVERPPTEGSGSDTQGHLARHGSGWIIGYSPGRGARASRRGAGSVSPPEPRGPAW